MALPKTLIRGLRPSIVILALGMLYAAYQQLQKSEHNAYQQSFANLKTASELVSSQIGAATGKLYILNNAQLSNQFDSAARNILNHNATYADIVYLDNQTGLYHSTRFALSQTRPSKPRLWHKSDNSSANIAVSSIYEKQPNTWVFAVKFEQKSGNEIWIEFDLKHTTQSLRGLRSLEKGYVFVVDRTTGRLVFHPDPNRIGSPSISYRGGIDELVNSGVQFGQHEYYYKNHYKVSVFNADNTHEWVFVAGTNRAEIFASAYQTSLAAIVIASLLLLVMIINYLTYQLNSSLARLNNTQDLSEFKYGLRSILDRFCFHSGVQVCFYNPDYGHFSTVDYHGNSNVILKDCKLAQRFTPSSLIYTNSRYADPLAKKLHINSRHYTIPLFDKEALIAVVYITARFPTYSSILRMIRDYSEVALSNLLLHKQLRSKDVMTHLDNKLTLREKIDTQIGCYGSYLAILDIDHFKKINDSLGHQCGDTVILHTAELMRKQFPKPGAISLARYGGEEFCILFKANDDQHAIEQCEHLRQIVANSLIDYDGDRFNYTVSIGISHIKESQHTTIGVADKALHHAKGLGRNRVVMESN